MTSNTDQIVEIPEHLFVLANEHITLDNADSWAALADECDKYLIAPEDVMSIVVRNVPDVING